jgi:hypothetical protein
MRSEQALFDDLARLCASTGFIHALASLAARDNIVIADQGRTVEDPRTVFPVTLLSDHYPALSFQSHQLLGAKTTEEIVAPIVTDVFALDAMTETLDSPLRFLSYLTLRSRFGGRLLADHELDLLAYHLKRNLWLASDVGLMRVEGDSDLYFAMASRRDDGSDAATPEGILTRFRGTHFSRTLEQIEDEPETAALELGLTLLELDEGTVSALNDGIGAISTLSVADGQPHRFTVVLEGGKTGLTAHVSRLSSQEAKASANQSLSGRLPPPANPLRELTR